VYWGAGTLVHPPKLFVSAAEAMTRELLPLDLWIDFRLELHADGTTSAFTTGLAALGHLEIEVAHSKMKPAEVRNRVWNSAHYLLDNGPVLRDCQTFGLTADEQIGVKHTSSTWDPSKTVIRLEM
jgi:hypothetical protein